MAIKNKNNNILNNIGNINFKNNNILNTIGSVKYKNSNGIIQNIWENWKISTTPLTVWSASQNFGTGGTWSYTIPANIMPIDLALNTSINQHVAISDKHAFMKIDITGNLENGTSIVIFDKWWETYTTGMNYQNYTQSIPKYINGNKVISITVKINVNAFTWYGSLQFAKYYTK